MKGIYILTNIVNGKQYVGQSSNMKRRVYSEHLLGSSRCTALQNAIAKYGRDAFIVELIACPKASQEVLNSLEICYVHVLQTLAPNGYNLQSGGDVDSTISNETRQRLSELNSGENNPRFGKTVSLETRRKLSESHKGKGHTLETRKKLSDMVKGENHHYYGKALSEEHRRKIGDAHRGMKRSPETCQRISAAKKGKNTGADNARFGTKHTPKTLEKMRKAHAKRQREKQREKGQMLLWGD